MSQELSEILLSLPPIQLQESWGFTHTRDMGSGESERRSSGVHHKLFSQLAISPLQMEDKDGATVFLLHIPLIPTHKSASLRSGTEPRPGFQLMPVPNCS